MKIYSIVLFLFLPSLLFAQQITLKSNFIDNGKTYFITLEKHNGEVTVWARKALQQSNREDISILTFNTKVMPDKDKAMSMICRAKNTVDNGRLILGCASVVGTGICVATGGGAGVGVPVCVATVGYAATTGLVDCVAGLTDKISSYFGYSDFGYAAEQAFNALSPTSLVSVAIDQACDDWENSR